MQEPLCHGDPQTLGTKLTTLGFSFHLGTFEIIGLYGPFFYKSTEFYLNYNGYKMELLSFTLLPVDLLHMLNVIKYIMILF